MKTRKQAAEKQKNWLLDPRLEKPLLIAIFCLSLFLAGLILLPTVGNYLRRLPEPEAAGLEQETEFEPFRLRMQPELREDPFVQTDLFTGWQRVGEAIYYVNQSGEALTGLQRIDGRLYYFAPDGRKARALGVDVSYYNEDVNWRQVRAQGIDFAIIRAGGRGWTYGTIYEDARTGQYLHNAREAGLRVGLYFYSTAGSEKEAAAEARMVLGVLNGETLDLPVFIDVEASGEYPKGRADLLTREERTRVIEAFCRVIEEAGYEAGIYSGQYFYNTSLYLPGESRRVLWLANYTDAQYNRMPAFGAGYEIWQFTDRGQVKGIPGYTDLNVIF